MHAKEVLSLESQANPTVLLCDCGYCPTYSLEFWPCNWFNLTNVYTVPDLKKLHVFLLSSFPYVIHSNKSVP